MDGFLPPYSMKPELIQSDVSRGQAIPATRQCWEGIVCDICGRCNLRRHWDAWRCRTEGCPFLKDANPMVEAAGNIATERGPYRPRG